jgi:SAM-dependent methyltransferase
VTNERYEDGAYAQANPGWHDEDGPWKAARIAALLLDNGISGGRICDIGCGTGGVLAALQQRMPGMSTVGYELSPQAVELARERHPEVDVRNEDVFAAEERFDVAMLIDVFEHVEDYVGFLRRASTLANLLVLHVPLDMSVVNVWRDHRLMAKRRDVGHLHYFSEQTALATLDLAGLEVIDVRFTSIESDVRQARGKERLLQWGMRAGYRLSESWTARVLGGGSLLVLARPTQID